MYVVFLAGGIASGKSTVARELKRLGAHVVDLDELSRKVTAGSSAVNGELARAFGSDVLDERGFLRRAVLAERAFASQERTRLLERIVHPHIRTELAHWIERQDNDALCVVEIPLLDRVEDLLPMANEVLCVVCPLEERRVRAVGRGMDASDFDARVLQQPTDAYLKEHATTVIDNSGDEQALIAQTHSWWQVTNEALGKDPQILLPA